MYSPFEQAGVDHLGEYHHYYVYYTILCCIFYFTQKTLYINTLIHYTLIIFNTDSSMSEKMRKTNFVCECKLKMYAIY